MTDEHTPERITIWTEKMWRHAMPSPQCGPTGSETCEYVRADIADELLEALEKLHVYFENSGAAISQRWVNIPPGSRADIVKSMKAAIAKARGQRK